MILYRQYNKSPFNFEISFNLYSKISIYYFRDELASESYQI